MDENQGNFVGGSNQTSYGRADQLAEQERNSARAYSSGVNNPNSFDLLKLITSAAKSIVQSDPNNPMQNWKGTANTTQTINPDTGLHDDQAKAIQGVLSKYDKQQAEEAFAMKGPEAMRQLLDYHYSTSPSNQEDGSSSSNKQDSSTGIQKQAMGIVNPQGVHPLGLLLNLIGNMTGANAVAEGVKSLKLNNLRGAQTILGKEPLQQEEIDKSALETQQKINQALTVPPTQAERLSNAAAYAGYKTTALKDMLDNNNTAMTQQNDILKNMQGYSSWINKPFGTIPKEAQQAVKRLKQLQLERTGINSELNKHQQLLASGGVSKSPFIEGQVYTDAQGNKATFKNGKFQ